ncbi:MAG: septum formation initiator family protein [Planctomycetes bacterium]|nr:septum formation initiator family protein [Planctomycetota bacterium]
MNTYYSSQRPRTSGVTKYFWHFIFGAIIIFLVTSSLAAYIKNNRLENYIRTLDNEIAAIKSENISLARQVNAISSDPVYREAVIRRELKLGLPGEMIILPR